MFSKLSQRERMMAIAVAMLLPAAIVMYLFVTINGALSDKASQIDALTQDQQQLMLKKATAQRVVSRGEQYRQESLPSDINRSLQDYYSWLSHLSEASLGGSRISINKGILTPENLGIGDLVFSKQEFSVSTTASLKQVTEFLYRFNESKILHRIKSITLKPEMTGSGDRMTMTGLLVVNIGVEVAAMADADAERDFADGKRDSMLRTLDEYHDVVTRRNLFGLPNATPSFSTSGSQDIVTGNKVSIPLKVEDDGDSASLKYELIETSVPDAKLVLDAAKATFSAPALPKGEHKFLVRATDNGWPRKSDDLELTINVDDPPPFVASAPDPPPQFAKYAFVSGFTTNPTGSPVVWIKIPQPDNQTHRLQIGESFELDEKQWKVTDISGEQVTFDVDGKSMSFKFRSTLDKPVIETSGVSSSR